MKTPILFINANGALVEGTTTSLQEGIQSPLNDESNAAESSWPAMAQMLQLIQTLNSASILRINSITPSQKN